MPGRKFSSVTQYRYGFNGKEEDDEVKGDGNQQDYGMRIYDTRLGRFLSVDPLTASYPHYTPYSFAGNKSIWAIDIDGLEDKIITHWITLGLDGKKTEIVYVNEYGVEGSVGPLGRGTLEEYYYQKRKAVKNPNYGKPGNTLSKYLDVPDGQNRFMGALFTPADPVRKKMGGFWFTSSGAESADGYGSPVDLDPSNAIPINIDLLMGVIGGSSLYERDLPEAKSKKLEIVIEFLERISKLSEAGQTGYDATEALEEDVKLFIKEKKNETGQRKNIELLPETKKPKDTCPVCGAPQEDSQHINKTIRSINKERLQKLGN